MRLNRIGKRYGKLKVISCAGVLPFGTQGRMRLMWNCVCKCGNKCAVAASHLSNSRKKVTKSCGCLLHNTGANAANFRHGHARDVEYRAYHGAKARCLNPKNASYNDYGRRGIKFLYTSFEQFLNDVGKRPSPKHSLDRIKHNSHYKVGNCRWATRSVQQKNKRSVGSIESFPDAIIRREFYRRKLDF